jgi:hypothetical protein
VSVRNFFLFINSCGSTCQERRIFLFPSISPHSLPNGRVIWRCRCMSTCEHRPLQFLMKEDFVTVAGARVPHFLGMNHREVLYFTGDHNCRSLKLSRIF